MTSSALQGFTIELDDGYFSVNTTNDANLRIPVTVFDAQEAVVDVVTTWLTAELPDQIEAALAELKTEAAYPFDADGLYKFAKRHWVNQDEL